MILGDDVARWFTPLAGNKGIGPTGKENSDAAGKDSSFVNSM